MLALSSAPFRRHLRYLPRRLSVFRLIAPGLRVAYVQASTTTGGQSMNKDQIKGNWMQFKGKVKEQWGKLTDDDLDIIEGRSDQLIGKLQERYGIAKQEAERQFKEFLDACDETKKAA